MTNHHGDFIWYELMTRDPDGAKAFYDSVVGWQIGPKPSGEMDYRMIAVGDSQVGGVFPLTEDHCAQGARPCWMGYVGVDDVDATVAKLQTLGGRVLLPAFDIPDVGRIAMVCDPQGVPFYVMRGAVAGHTSTAFQPRTVGHCAWNELTSADPSAALGFYGELFGWRNLQSFPMGEGLDYRLLDHLGLQIGALGPLVEPQQQPGWLYYFRVDQLERAMAAIKAGRGQVLHGPMEVPEGDYIVIGLDPDGAVFALVGPLD